MLCGYCLGEVEKLVMSEYSGVEVCEDCYWMEVITEEVDAMAEMARENDLRSPGPGFRMPGPGLPE